MKLGPKGRKWALKDKNGWAVGRSGDNCPTLKRRGKAVARIICKKVAEKVLAPAKGIEIKGGNTFKYVATWSTGVNVFTNPKGSRLTYDGSPDKKRWTLKEEVPKTYLTKSFKI